MWFGWCSYILYIYARSERKRLRDRERKTDRVRETDIMGETDSHREGEEREWGGGGATYQKNAWFLVSVLRYL